MFSNQPFLQNWVQVKSSDGSSYINLDRPGIAAAALILYAFSKKRSNLFIASSYFNLFSISVRYRRKLLGYETLMVDLVYAGMLIIGPLNQFESPVRRIISVSSILVMVRIGLLSIDRVGMNSVLLSNTS